jgi:RNA polymerase sigma-70 factor, ECF subfamily
MANSPSSDGIRSAVVIAEPDVVTMHDQGDVGLLHKVAEGDRTALAALYHRHAGAVLAHLTLITGDHGLSEEVLQDTMLAVWRGAASYQGLASVRSWIIAIARRQHRDRLRRGRLRIVHQEAVIEQPATDPGPEEIALERAAAGEVARAVTTLGLPHREVLSLVFGSGLTLAETAAALQIPVGTVKSRLSSARSALARALRETSAPHEKGSER